MAEELLVSKVDGNTLRVTKSVPQSQDYTRDYLVQQRANLIAQRDSFVSQRNVQIEELDALLSRCDELNIVSETIV